VLHFCAPFVIYSVGTMAQKKTIKKRLQKDCVVCGKQMRVISYIDRSYRGGHYFGKHPLFTDEALAEAHKAGTHEEVMGGRVIHVMNKNPIPYDYAEYWECPKCYWGARYPKKDRQESGFLG